MTHQIMKCCNQCGSENVCYTGEAVWDTSTQRWVLNMWADLDNAYCYDCAETNIVDVISKEVIICPMITEENGDQTFCQPEDNHENRPLFYAVYLRLNFDGGEFDAVYEKDFTDMAQAFEYAVRLAEDHGIEPDEIDNQVGRVRP